MLLCVVVINVVKKHSNRCEVDFVQGGQGGGEDGDERTGPPMSGPCRCGRVTAIE